METSRLTYLETRGKNKHGHSVALFRCVCGTEKVLEISRVKTGRVKSCGCLKIECTKGRWETYRCFSFPSRLKELLHGCLEWEGPVGGTGYGYIGYEGKQWRTHRLAYKLKHGEIPSGLFVLHKCDNKRCCNPDHLYLGTNDDNMRDVVGRGRRKGINAGEKNGRAKLVMAQIAEIRSTYAAGGISQEKLSAQYGVSQDAISKIIRNKRYEI